MLEIVLIRGLPGSGKTTMALALCEERDYEHVEADHFFETAKGYVYLPELVKNAHAFCLERTTDALRNKRSVVVSNTFSRIWEMASYYKLAGEFGISVRVIVARGTWPSINCGPDVVAKMAERWEEH